LPTGRIQLPKWRIQSQKWRIQLPKPVTNFTSVGVGEMFCRFTDIPTINPSWLCTEHVTVKKVVNKAISGIAFISCNYLGHLSVKSVAARL